MIFCGQAVLHLLWSFLKILKESPSFAAAKAGILNLFKNVFSEEETLIRLFFVFENTVAISLITSFHPVTLLYGTAVELPFPSAAQNFMHCTVLFTIERGFRYWVYQILLSGGANQSSISRSHGNDVAAFKIAGEFMAYKGTLILAMAVIGGSNPLGIHSNRLHFISIVLWAVLRRCYSPIEFRALS